MVSGYLDQDSTARLTAIPGVLGTLPKPFDFELLEARVLECLAARPAAAEPVATEGTIEHAPEAPAPATEPAAGGWIEIRPASAGPDGATGGGAEEGQGATNAASGESAGEADGQRAPQMMRLHG